jgi:serine/threonine-protein kinase
VDPDRWARVQELFHRAADLPAAERDALLAAECGDDERLREEVRALLDSDHRPDPLLDRDVAHVAEALLDATRGAAIPDAAFGPYRLTRLLGEGGMGVVYLARRDDLDSVAAVKILRDAWLSPARRDRFLAEQRTLAQLVHPSIARLYDAGTLPDGTPWIAMEYVEGVALTEFCRARRAPLRERLRLVRSVCDAVLHAHQQLVVHRDLKPSNVLVRDDGSVRLLDFGIARQLERLDAPADPTRTGLRLMTPAYASPEQVAGRPVGMQADVYSLGVILYELLTGVLPFDLSDRTPGEIERMILQEEPVRPSLRARGLAGAGYAGISAGADAWADLDVLCATAMHRDPARRYPSVDALARDIDRFLDGEPLEARGDSLGYRAAKFLRRHARIVGAGAAIALAGIALVTFYTVRLQRARDLAVTESVRAQRIQRFVTDLFQGGDEAAGPAESLRVVTLLDQGVLDARALDREPAVQADLYQTIGGIYRQLGQLDRADSLLQAGLAQWRRLAGAGSLEAARGLRALGDLRTEQARYDDAERLLRESLAIVRRAGHADDPATGDALAALGRAMTERGEHRRALVVLDSAVVLLARVAPDSPEHLRALAEVANARFYAGDYAGADSVNRDVLAMTRRIYGERHPLVAEDLMNLGATEQERGNYQAAEALFREALSITTGFYGEHHPRTAGNLVYLGRALLLQGRYAGAREALGRSLGIREQVYGADHPSVANVLNELGSLAVQEDRYDDARAAYERVLRIFRATYPGRSFRVGVAMANLADVHLYSREYDRAEPLYREALEHYLATQGPEHLNTGIAHIKLGRCLLRAGRFREAEVETQRGYTIVSKVASPEVNFLQAARLDLSIAYDSLGEPARAATYRAERQRYLPQPAPPSPSPPPPPAAAAGRK